MTKVNGKMKYQRIFVIVLDSVGMGYMPDAAKFGDEGADTLGHLGKYLHRSHEKYMKKYREKYTGVLSGKPESNGRYSSC